jgi:hypothetical protein
VLKTSPDRFYGGSYGEEEKRLAYDAPEKKRLACDAPEKSRCEKEKGCEVEESQKIATPKIALIESRRSCRCLA